LELLFGQGVVWGGGVCVGEAGFWGQCFVHMMAVLLCIRFYVLACGN